MLRHGRGAGSPRLSSSGRLAAAPQPAHLRRARLPPEAPLALLAVLQPHPPSFARLRAALDAEHEIVPCDTWPQLWTTVLTRPVNGCVVELRADDRVGALREIQRLRRRRPPLALVVEADFRGHELDLFGLGRLGVDGVIPAETLPGRGDVRTTIERALSSALATRVTEAMEGRYAELGLEGLRWAITHALEKPTVNDLATALGRTSDVLAREFRAMRLPPPRRLLLWGRLFQAGRLIAGSTRSVEAVALELGYSGRTALSRALRRETGHPPTEVVRRGGVSCVLSSFLSGGRRGGRR